MDTNKCFDEMRVGLVGCGIVGGGVAEALLSAAKRRDLRFDGIKLVKVADVNWPKAAKLGNGITVPASMRCRSYEEIVDDPSIDVVVELVGGTGVAFDVVKKSLEAGKDVVTANKALLAKKGSELFKLAFRKGCEIAFEAAVAGGIPILSAVRTGLAANGITTVYGILNGTTNFILTRMSETGCSFDAALKEAQRLGFAEADPTLDIEGYDAAHKIQLLTSLALGKTAKLDRIPVQGIQNVSAIDISYARQLGCVIKLIARSASVPSGLQIEVAPTLIARNHPLANVNNEINAVVTESDMAGRTLFVGRGAGRYPTASAVLADLLELSYCGGSYVERMIAAKSVVPASKGDYRSEFYLRVSAMDKPGVLGKVTSILGEQGISIKSCVQLEECNETSTVPVVLLTHVTTLEKIIAAKKKISGLSVIRSEPVHFSVIE